MKLENKPNNFNKEEYIKICTDLWGSVPVDVTWAMETLKYKNHCEKTRCQNKERRYIIGIDPINLEKGSGLLAYNIT